MPTSLLTWATSVVCECHLGYCSSVLKVKGFLAAEVDRRIGILWIANFASESFVLVTDFDSTYFRA